MKEAESLIIGCIERRWAWDKVKTIECRGVTTYSSPVKETKVVKGNAER